MKADTAAEPREGFARRYRLTKTDEFSSVFGFRRAIRGESLMVHYLPRPDGADQQPRLGLVIGKKLLKAAVRRNILKRLIRECFRRMKDGLPPCDVVVRLVTKTGKVDRKAMAAEIEVLFAKLARRFAKAAGKP